MGSEDGDAAMVDAEEIAEGNQSERNRWDVVQSPFPRHLGDDAATQRGQRQTYVLLPRHRLPRAPFPITACQDLRSLSLTVFFYLPLSIYHSIFLVTYLDPDPIILFYLF